MRYKLLGRSGLRVSQLCLGTMTFGEDWGWGASEAEARAVYDAYRGAGGNFVDTANLYTGGSSEKMLGVFLKDDRDAVVLATKFTDAPPGNDPNAGGNGRKTMMQAVEASLKRLGTDRIDLYWVHAWDFMTPPEEIMRGLDDLVRAGKVLHVGVSDAPAWAVAQANTLALLRGWTPFIGLQVEYSLAERTPERELLPMGRALDLGVLAWSPLASGVLTGKYLKGDDKDANKDGRVAKTGMADKLLSERNRTITQAVVDVAEEIGCEPGQVALAWLVRRGVIPILGARTVDQLRANVSCLDVALSDAQAAKLEAASAIDLGFPHDFLRETRHFTYGGMFDRIDRHADYGLGVL